MSQFRPSWHYGCDHGQDIIFTLGYVLLNDVLDDDDAEFTADEMDFSKMLMKYWANFVKTGQVNIVVISRGGVLESRVFEGCNTFNSTNSDQCLYVVFQKSKW